METVFKRVSISWLDSAYHAGWKKHDELEAIAQSKPMIIKSVGWLIADNSDHVVIAQSVSDTQADGILQIPKSAIISEHDAE